LRSIRGTLRYEPTDSCRTVSRAVRTPKKVPVFEVRVKEWFREGDRTPEAGAGLFADG